MASVTKTVKVPRDLAGLLARAARRRGVSESELIRESVQTSAAARGYGGCQGFCRLFPRPLNPPIAGAEETELRMTRMGRIGSGLLPVTGLFDGALSRSLSDHENLVDRHFPAACPPRLLCCRGTHALNSVSIFRFAGVRRLRFAARARCLIPQSHIRPSKGFSVWP